MTSDLFYQLLALVGLLGGVAFGYRRWIAPRHNTAMHRRMPGLHPATHHRREARGTVMSMLHGVTVLGEPSQHVEKALCSHDAVDYLTQ